MYEYEIRNAVVRGTNPAMLLIQKGLADYVRTDLKGEVRLIGLMRKIKNGYR